MPFKTIIIFRLPAYHNSILFFLFSFRLAITWPLIICQRPLLTRGAAAGACHRPPEASQGVHLLGGGINVDAWFNKQASFSKINLSNIIPVDQHTNQIKSNRPPFHFNSLFLQKSPSKTVSSLPFSPFPFSLSILKGNKEDSDSNERGRIYLWSTSSRFKLLSCNSLLYYVLFLLYFMLNKKVDQSNSTCSILLAKL